MRPLWRDLIRRSALAMRPARSSSGSCDHDSPPAGCDGVPDEEPDLDGFNCPRNPSDPDPDAFDQIPAWQAEEIPLGDGRILFLDHT